MFPIPHSFSPPPFLTFTSQASNFQPFQTHTSHTSTTQPQQTNPFLSSIPDTSSCNPLLASTQHILDRIQKLEVGNQDLNNNQTYEQLCNEPKHPLVSYHMLPTNFELPKFDKFKGKEDPKDHLRICKHE